MCEAAPVEVTLEDPYWANWEIETVESVEWIPVGTENVVDGAWVLEVELVETTLEDSS